MRTETKARVLVLGGAGYIGTCVTERLIERGYHPVIFDTFYWGADVFKAFAEGSYTLVEGDVRNARDVAYALEGIDGGVIHLAGIVGEPACAQNHTAHVTTNIESVRILVNCMTHTDLNYVRDLVYCSSCSVYGNVAGQYDEVVETTPTMPLSQYAQGKLLAEEIILEKAFEESLFTPTILRLTTIFGWSHRVRLDLVANLFAYKAVLGEEIVLHGGGGQYRSMVHVRDVASALVTALEAPRYLRRGEIFHVGEESNNVTLAQIAQKVKEIVPEVKIRNSENAAADRRDYRINCQKIKNALNWKAQYSVDAGLDEMVKKLRESALDFSQEKFGNSKFIYT